MTTISALPIAPDINDKSTFESRAENFVAALPAFVTQTNLVGSEVNANALSASASAFLASISAATSVALTNVNAWVSGTTYTAGNLVYSPITFSSYRRKTNGAGTTDPSADTTNWMLLYQGNTVTAEQFGILLDGVTDNTAALQSAWNYCANFVAKLLVGPGVCLHTGITATGPMHMVGAGKGTTVFRLANGSNKSPFAFPAVAYGSGLGDNKHSILKGFTVEGNYLNQTGTSHGLEFPSTAWAMSTEYSVSAIINQVEVKNCLSNGVFLGTNRNWCLMTECDIRYNNQSGLFNNSVDNRFDRCDFGMTRGNGEPNVRINAGGSLVFNACNIFGTNNAYNVTIATFAGSYVEFNSGAFDIADLGGMYISSGGAVNETVVVRGGRFQGNSKSATGVYPDIMAVDVKGLSVCNVAFIYDSANRPNYLIQTVGTTENVQWSGNQYEMVDTPNIPYATAVTNDWTKLLCPGHRGTGIRMASNTAMSAYANNVEATQFTSSLVIDKLNHWIQKSGPGYFWQDTGAGANLKTWTADAISNQLRIYPLSDLSTNTRKAFTATRSGANGDDVSVVTLADTLSVVPLSGVSLLNATGSFGGGNGVVFLANATTIPTANPVGGVLFYSDAGTLKCRGPSGTVTTIAVP